ncbi:MAG: hypothetical protein QOI57_2674 [Rubrobacteraceae bacterium]|jgi:hypothetical protein|nr:hypothetical protein [Rubrobacteraceae bacterium]
MRRWNKEGERPTTPGKRCEKNRNAISGTAETNPCIRKFFNVAEVYEGHTLVTPWRVGLFGGVKYTYGSNVPNRGI